jgi:hypothetical protein
VCVSSGRRRTAQPRTCFVRLMPVFSFIYSTLQLSCYVLCHRTCGHQFISEEVHSRRRHAHIYLYGYVAASSHYGRSECNILKVKQYTLILRAVYVLWEFGFDLSYRAIPVSTELNRCQRKTKRQVIQQMVFGV